MRVQPLFLAFAACATAVDGSSPPRDVLAATPTPGRASVDRGPDGRERADGAPAGVPDPFDALRIRYRPAGDVAEGRGKKKKNKDKKNKMGLMMGAAAMGMTVIGGIATKMMMGGVTMIAMKALIIAKLALLLASVIALKKLIGGGGGGGLAGGGVAAGPSWNGGVGGVADAGGGYRRSYGDDAAAASAEHGLSAANALAYRDQIGNSYGRSQ